MKRLKHIGAYGIITKNNKILLIKKNGGPYDGKLDLPGGTIEFDEKIEEALIREMEEEVGIRITNYKLFDVISSNITWEHKGEIEEIKHIGILYKIEEYTGEINKDVIITDKNDDSKGAEYYDINSLKDNELSNMVIEAISKLK